MIPISHVVIAVIVAVAFGVLQGYLIGRVHEFYLSNSKEYRK